ncbi:UDP-4-amino-4,6-dideoxy-N-acetyl-beta-L-altrosamine N-acetyltransferase [Petroclostridium sp. X23]|uniref:UDP-4-amino-4, 6-dideoxy-N-acetyl-beta-L-altrosamine N-acetyltransferase n=1 Tax=Petroclostridium sp. X23 TaxID=3045146 RepID=UPI0024ADCBAF|nr:UDP-4-amino-4,6-dideoxy-N-acetyl-beta-L-altrosamine N-acetyltransferase [Petroclostridium sp. X23]WHH58339.1 UDP-4-amino-4,6-dideoxy-N-acetyl-beta-L-altrosamine N-acetyltransferase [Petroclostridium sp. X23]
MMQGILVDLTPLSKEYIDVIRNWRNSPDVYRYLFSHYFITPEQQQSWYENLLRDKSKLYMMVIEKKDMKPVGLVWLNNIDNLHRTAEWGFFMGSKEGRNAGYAVEAEYLLIKYAFEYLNLHRLYGHVFTFNKKVISMHKRFGFQLEGILREHVYHEGEYKNVAVVGLLKQEYFAQQPVYKKMIDMFRKSSTFTE